MFGRRPRTAGSETERAGGGRFGATPLILSLLLLVAAGAGLFFLHQTGRLEPLIAGGPSIEVALPSAVPLAQSTTESPREPDAPAAEDPQADGGASAEAELDAPLASGPAAAGPGGEAAPAAEAELEPPPETRPAPEAVPPPEGSAAEAPLVEEPLVEEPAAEAPPAGTAAAPESETPPAATTADDTPEAAPEPPVTAPSAESAAPAAPEPPPPPAPPAPEIAEEEAGQPPAEPAETGPAETGPAETAGTEATSPAATADDAEVADDTDAGPGAADAPGQDPATAPQVAAATVPPGAAPAWREFARPFPSTETRPRIAIVVAGLGLSDAATTAAIQQLPSEITLSFSPYSNRIEEWVAMARAAGHEVMIDLPMEPASFPRDDPGPQALLTTVSDGTNAERLAWVLGRAEGYVGVASYMGSRFTTSPDHLRPVLEELERRGLMFLDSRAAADSEAAKLAGEIGLGHAINDRFLDHEASRVAIDGRLQQIERIARTKDVAVAMGYAYPVTIERLTRWVRGLPGKGLALAPISAVVNRQEDR